MYSGSWFKTLMMFFREANKFQVTLGFKIYWLSLLLEKVTTILILMHKKCQYWFINQKYL